LRRPKIRLIDAGLSEYNNPVIAELLL